MTIRAYWLRTVAVLMVLGLWPLSPALAQGSWSTRANLPVARQLPGVGVVNGLLYSVGGETANDCTFTNTNYAYDPVSDSWATKTPMPTRHRGPGVAVVNGLMYVMGGEIGCAVQTGTMESYDPTTDSWTTRPSMPTARSAVRSVAVGTTIYAIGGGTSTNLSTVEAFDTTAGTWSTKASMPTPRSGPVVGVINGMIYAAAGFGNTGCGSSDALEAYDPATDTWSTKAALPTPTDNPTGVVIGGKLYVFGGDDCGVKLSLTQVYDPATDTWSTATSMPGPRQNTGSGVIGSTAYVIGGLNATTNYLATNEAFTVDNTGPTITISVPSASTYTLNQPVPAIYSCTDPDDTVTICTGPVADGADIDTASVGTKTFTVNATDSNDNSSSASVDYTVTYNICPLYSQGTSVKSGATIPIKLQLCDLNGADQSASGIVVRATGVVMLSGNSSPYLQDAGNSNPDNDFRFDSTLGTTGGYIYNLSTKGYSSGTFALQFTAGSDPTTHSVQFQVR